MHKLKLALVAALAGFTVHCASTAPAFADPPTLCTVQQDQPLPVPGDMGVA